MDRAEPPLPDAPKAISPPGVAESSKVSTVERCRFSSGGEIEAIDRTVTRPTKPRAFRFGRRDFHAAVNLPAGRNRKKLSSGGVHASVKREWHVEIRKLFAANR